MRLRSFASSLKVILPEVQELISTLVAAVALLASVVALWHQFAQ